MPKEYLHYNVSLLERVKAIDPNLAAAYVVRAYAWPSAVLHRVAYYVEIGAEITPALTFARTQLDKRPILTKNEMIIFIKEQANQCERHLSTNRYKEVKLERTGIRLVDLTDPTSWTIESSYKRQSLICDLASIAQQTGNLAVTEFGEMMSAHSRYSSDCIVALNGTINNLYGGHPSIRR